MPKGVDGFQKGYIPWNKGMKGYTNSGSFKKGMPTWNTGIPWSEDVILKISKPKPSMCGENHPNYKHGKSLDKEYFKERARLRRIKFPEDYKARKHNRRIMTKDLNIKTIQMVYEDNIKKYGTLTCYLCEKPIEFKKDNLEHKTPLSRGGTNEYNNLAVACKSCNCKKHAKTEQEYRKEKSLWGTVSQVVN